MIRRLWFWLRCLFGHDIPTKGINYTVEGETLCLFLCTRCPLELQLTPNQGVRSFVQPAVKGYLS